MLGLAQLRRGAREHRTRVAQLGGGVHRATGLAAVAVLVGCAAARAAALNEAVGQKHALVGVKKLLNRALGNQPVVAQRQVNALRQLVVFGAVGAVPVVKADGKAVKVRLAAAGNLCHKRLRGKPGFFCGNHDGCAVRVVGANKVHLMPVHAQCPHPNVGLDVLHDVPNVKLAVGIGQGGGNKQAAVGGGRGTHVGRYCRNTSPAA